MNEIFTTDLHVVDLDLSGPLFFKPRCISLVSDFVAISLNDMPSFLHTVITLISTGHQGCLVLDSQVNVFKM